MSCTSKRACTAVGSFSNKHGYFALVERWNGSSWSVQPTPTDVVGAGAEFYAVSCISATECMAVGQGSLFAQGLPTGYEYCDSMTVQRWDGTEWSILPRPCAGLSTGGTYPVGLSCVSRSACAAVGTFDVEDFGSLPLAVRWNGTRWTRPADLGAAENGDLLSVSCTAAACTAVGTISDPVGTIIARWNGRRWSAAPVHVRGLSLRGVSCASATDCIAVGDSRGGAASMVLGGQLPPAPTTGLG